MHISTFNLSIIIHKFTMKSSRYDINITLCVNFINVLLKKNAKSTVCQKYTSISISFYLISVYK